MPHKVISNVLPVAVAAVKHPSVALVSLGCPKNLVDSEEMLGRLESAGCEIAQDPADADVIIVNTCGFIEDAKRESINTILEMARLKASGKKLVVAGCLAQRYGDEIKREIPEIDQMLGVTGQERITELIGVEADTHDHRHHRVLTGSGHHAYVKIAEGCNQTCSFCAIPGIRGPQRSRAIGNIVSEAQELVSRGVGEIILVAQDTSNYGRDLRERPTLAGLLRAVARVKGVRWVRLNYLYPNHVTDDLLKTIAEEPAVCKYVDVPLQHADPDVLAGMRRGGSAESHMQLIDRIRGAISGVFIRSAFIVGFPLETEDAFERLLTFLDRARIDHVGVFTYSREEQTPAWALGDPVTAREKLRRRSRAMAAQQKISLATNLSRVGSRHDAIVEAVDNTYYICRIRDQAPDVDGVTRVKRTSGRRGSPPAIPLEPGQFVRVKITGAGPYDFLAVVDEGA